MSQVHLNVKDYQGLTTINQLPGQISEKIEVYLIKIIQCLT